MFERLRDGWDGVDLVARLDEISGAWMFIGVHSTVLGPAMGGTRMKPYPSPDEGAADAIRLSEAMTVKQAAADLPFGGGKAVLSVTEIPPRGSPERRELLLRYADLVESLGGSYVTAADMNTGPLDMDVIGERTTHVLGRSRERGGSGDPGEGTATGVFHGIRATVGRVFSDADLSNRSIVVQGVGSVGGRLCRRLVDAGAHVTVADADARRAEAIAEETGAELVDLDSVYDVECDVFAPCATGGVISEATVPRLRCRIVAGAANNQLAQPQDAARLRDAGIVYAPDFVINGGGVIHLAGYETFGWDENRVEQRLVGIGATLHRIYDAAESEGITTAEAAQRLARRRIEVAAEGLMT
jgi:leucine dehydrogenase